MADLSLVDLDRAWTIRGAALHGRSRFTPFEGWTGVGVPVATVVRGRVAMLLDTDRLDMDRRGRDRPDPA
jgi:dihydroorotase-like cyclic amidohydrolase